LRSLFRRNHVEQDLSEELQFHLDQKTQEFLAAGLSLNEAGRKARREFGGLEQSKENCRDTRRVNFIETLLQDVRFGLRMLGKSPGFTATAVLTLGLGIGANTAMFSVVNAAVLSPLGYFQPDRLVMVWENNPRFPRVWVSYPNFQDWQRSARSFQEMAAGTEQGVDLTGPGTPEHLDGKEISSGFFHTLGVKLALGREFSMEEDRHGGAPVTIVSNRLWRNRFGGSPEVLGKYVTLGGVDYTIVGVLPSGFRLGRPYADVYTPLGQSDPLLLNDRAAHDGIFSLARLEPGVTIDQSQAQMSTLQNGLDQLYPDANRDLGIYIEPLKQVVVGNVGKMLLLLSGAVGFVLLIACANVANLLLSRSAGRAREFAIRSAIGANRARLVRQLLTESALLAMLGAGLGLLIAMLGVRSLLAAIPDILPRSESIGVNAPVLLFTLGVSLAVGILFGLVPALKGWNTHPQELKEGGRGSTRAHHRAQSSLVVVQMALTLVLLVGAGLLFRTIRHLWDVNPGFETQHLITFKVGVSHSLTKTAASTRTAYQHLIARIRQIPGVQAADFTDVVPLSGQGGTMPFWIGSEKPASLQAAPRLVGFLTGPDYLRTMGIPLLRGRFFTAEDTPTSPCVMVIDSAFARMYFADSDPLSQTITAGFEPVGPCKIVGVVGHVKQWELGSSNDGIQNQMYFPLYQDPDQWVPLNYAATTVVVRTPLDAVTVMPSVKGAIYAESGDQPVYNVHTMQEIVSESMSSQRFPMILLGTFAGFALLLASIGIYGVISYSVAQRVHEIGIRTALGARERDVFRMVIGQGFGLALAGVVIGIAASLILTRLLSSFAHLLYGVGASDPATFVTVAVVLTGVAVLACYIPARRATRVDPMVALRYD
jgi:predicted permease